jgi:hypothetical protein
LFLQLLKLFCKRLALLNGTETWSDYRILPLITFNSRMLGGEKNFEEGTCLREYRCIRGWAWNKTEKKSLFLIRPMHGARGYQTEI